MKFLKKSLGGGESLSKRNCGKKQKSTSLLSGLNMTSSNLLSGGEIALTEE